MNRPDPSPEGELRHRAHALVRRLDVLTDGWLAGSAPTSQQIDAAADDVAALRDLIATPHLQIQRTEARHGAPPVPLRVA